LRDIPENDIGSVRRRSAGFFSRFGGLVSVDIRLGDRLARIHAAQPFHELGRRHRGKIAAVPKMNRALPKMNQSIQGIGQRALQTINQAPLAIDIPSLSCRRRSRSRSHRRAVGAHPHDKVVTCGNDGRFSGFPVRLSEIAVPGLQQSRVDNVFRQHLVEHLPEHMFQPFFAHRADAVNDFNE
jgi:hypothetical protein